MVHTIALEAGDYVVWRCKDWQEVLQVWDNESLVDFDCGVRIRDGVIYTDHYGNYCVIQRKDQQDNSKVFLSFSCSVFALFISTPLDKKIMVDHTCHVLDDTFEEGDESMFDDY